MTFDPAGGVVVRTLPAARTQRYNTVSNPPPLTPPRFLRAWTGMGEDADGWPPDQWTWPPRPCHVPQVSECAARAACDAQRRHKLPPTAAADIGQEVLKRIFADQDSPPQSLAQFEERCEAEAVNAARREQRYMWRRRELMADWLPDTKAAPESGFANVLEALPVGPVRDVIRMRFVEGLSREKVAESLGMTVWKVYQFTEDGRRHLKARFNLPAPQEDRP